MSSTLWPPYCLKESINQRIKSVIESVFTFWHDQDINKITQGYISGPVLTSIRPKIIFWLFETTGQNRKLHKIWPVDE